MGQPTAKVNQDDILRIVKRDFPDDDAKEILGILNRYGTEEWEREPHRVQAAALKLSAGNKAKLVNEIDNAKADYRDTLLYAEYPNYQKKIFKKLNDTEKEKIYQVDLEQYLAWFNKPS